MKKISIIMTLFIILSIVFAPQTTFAANALDIGDTAVLYTSDAYTSYVPVGDVSRSYMWSSSNSSVIQIVSTSGNMCVVKAVGAGNAIVSNTQSMSYTYYDSRLGFMPGYETGFGDSYSLKVNPIPPTSVSLPSSASVYAGSSTTLSVTYTPSNAGSSLTWKSSNTSVATVSDGTVRGVKPGTATITVTTENGLKDTCKVTVTARDLKFSSSSPEDGSIDVSKNKVISFTFNDDIQSGTAYSSVTLKDNTNGKSVDITKEISGQKLKITPSELMAGHTYTAKVPAKAVKSIYGKNLTSASQISFTVENLTFKSVTPEDGDINVDPNCAINFEFEEELMKGDNFGDISVVNAETGAKLSYYAGVSGTSLIIMPYNLEYLTEYAVTIPIGAIKNADGFAQTKEYSSSFITKPGELEIRESDIYDGQKNVSTKIGKIYITFNYPIYKGDNYTDISVIDCDRDTSVSVIKNVSGNNLIMNVTGNIRYGSAYKIRIPENSLENGAGEGIAYMEIEFETAYETVEVPEISFDGQEVEISSETYGNIYYTTDGSDPKVYGVLYEEPFEVRQSETLVRAVVFENAVISEETSLLCRTPLANVGLKKTFGGEDVEEYLDVSSYEYGYVAVGYGDKYTFDTALWTDVYGKGSDDAIIVKYDEDGYVDWKKNYGSAGADSFEGVIITSDEDIVAVGNIYSGDAMIVKFTDYGSRLWYDTIGGDSTDAFYGVAELSDGYVAVGFSRAGSFQTGDWDGISAIGDSSDATIVKYDFEGDVLWQKNFGVGDHSCFYDVASCPDGFVASGECENDDGGRAGLIAKFDTNGNEIWRKIYGGVKELYAVATDGDCCVAVGGSEVIKFDSDGEVIWTKIADDYYTYEDICVDKGGYGAVGNDGSDAVIVKYDKDGKLIMDETFGSSKKDYFTGIDNTENGYVVAGYSAGGGFNKNDWTGVYGYGLEDATIVEYEYVPQEGDVVCDKTMSLKELGIKGKTYISKPEKYEVVTFPENADCDKVTWSVDDEDIAHIDQSGSLVPKGTGWVRVEAKCEGVTTRYDVYVTYIAPPKLVYDTMTSDGITYFNIRCENPGDGIRGGTLAIAEKHSGNIHANTYFFDDITLLNEEDFFGISASGISDGTILKFMMVNPDNFAPLAQSCEFTFGSK